jgi:lipopolysaccharide export system protein LptA
MFPRAILMLAVLLPPLPGAALAQGERSLPIHIEADSALLDDQRGTSVYRGNVRITQGQTVITADQVTVHAPGRVVEHLVAEGDLARLRTLSEEGREMHAEARRMSTSRPSAGWY